MTQKCLNIVLVCHVYFCRLRDIDVDCVMNVFIALNDSLDRAQVCYAAKLEENINIVCFNESASMSQYSNESVTRKLQTLNAAVMFNYSSVSCSKVIERNNDLSICLFGV